MSRHEFARLVDSSIKPLTSRSTRRPPAAKAAVIKMGARSKERKASG